VWFGRLGLEAKEFIDVNLDVKLQRAIPGSIIGKSHEEHIGVL